VPLVSIVIPCYNAAPWLRDTLKSALAQTWADKEILVVDDGSTDESVTIARSFVPQGISVTVQPNRGASAARNHGLRLARGEFIQFLDADDLLTPDKITAQMDLLRTARNDAVATCRWARFTDDPAKAAYFDSEVFCDLDPRDYLISHTARLGTMHPAAWLVPRAVADRAGPWDESLSLNDDGEYFARVALAASRIVFSATGASLYRSGLPSSLSRQRSPRALQSLLRSIELVAGHLRRAEDSPRTRQALADYWQRLAFEVYPDSIEIHRRATAESRALGGSKIQPSMGARQQTLARVIGWKLARRLARQFGR
jgi:glycosyltransferase involved in cell wall biosynthesis